MTLTYDNEEFYRAHLARDPRFDGKFFVAVKTTKIYCRPTCPARKARLHNLEFFIHKAQAEEAGYQPCLRCRPETSPGSAAWIGTSSTVQRAMRLRIVYKKLKLYVYPSTLKEHAQKNEYLKQQKVVERFLRVGKSLITGLKYSIKNFK